MQLANWEGQCDANERPEHVIKEERSVDFLTPKDETSTQRTRKREKVLLRELNEILVDLGYPGQSLTLQNTYIACIIMAR